MMMSVAVTSAKPRLASIAASERDAAGRSADDLDI
jgi:hypothetical protein